MTEEAYLERRRKLQANQPKWTLLQVIRCWLAWRDFVAAYDWGEELPPPTFRKYMDSWAAQYAEDRIRKQAKRGAANA
jgi:hypothetical protein